MYFDGSFDWYSQCYHIHREFITVMGILEKFRIRLMGNFKSQVKVGTATSSPVVLPCLYCFEGTGISLMVVAVVRRRFLAIVAAAAPAVGAKTFGARSRPGPFRPGERGGPTDETTEEYDIVDVKRYCL
jgi:hypothetical protein